MDKIIIIDDSGIKKELEAFLMANKNHIRLSSDMDELSLGQNPVLKEIVRRYEEKHKVKIQSKDHVRFYKLNDIIHFEAAENFTFIYQSDGTKNIVNETIDSIEIQLQDFPFFRTHPNHIVNLHHIVRVSDQSENRIELSTGDNVPVTASKKEIIIDFLNKYIQ
ncbi:MAG: LytTR family transcriptional regulator DNA-binding domain-containing protein [Bacteroidales bacterium]